jgi:hypothetical protein
MWTYRNYKIYVNIPQSQGICEHIAITRCMRKYCNHNAYVNISQSACEQIAITRYTWTYHNHKARVYVNISLTIFMWTSRKVCVNKLQSRVTCEYITIAKYTWTYGSLASCTRTYRNHKVYVSTPQSQCRCEHVATTSEEASIKPHFAARGYTYRLC